MSADSWTLSFKHNRITILLLAEPLTPLSTLKEELLSILIERYPAGLPHASSTPSSPTDDPETSSPIPHPSSSAEIILGKRSNEASEDELEWEEVVLKAKDTPKSLGLHDASCLAFAYVEDWQENGFVVRKCTFYEDQERAEQEAEAATAEEMEEDDA